MLNEYYISKLEESSKKSFDIYTNQWKTILKYIRKQYEKMNLDKTIPKENFDVFDVLYNRCKYSEISELIYCGNIINVNQNYQLIKNYFEKSRQHVIDDIGDIDDIDKNTKKYDLLIEFGSGWGTNVFYYISKNIDIKIISGEYTNIGVETQQFIKDKYYPNSNLDIYQFDFNNSDDFFNKISNTKFSNVLITTFWAIEQVYMLSESFIDNIIKHFPQFKIYFLEPVGWQISNDGHMKHKFEKKNTYYYNENL